MAIATLLISTMILKATGMIGMPGMVAAIAIGSVICIIAAIAGDTSQDLKTGYIVGATPVKQQIGELIGVVASALAIGGVLYLLGKAWDYGSTELPAPQATLMKMVDRRRNGRQPALDARICRRWNCGRSRDSADSGTSVCGRLIPSDSFKYPDDGRRSDQMVL